MSNDSCRTHLITELACSECSRLLKMSYDKPKRIAGDNSYIPNHSPGEPTGTAMVRTVITVHPCECTLIASRNLERLKELLK